MQTKASRLHERGATLLELLLVTGLVSLLGLMTFTAQREHADDHRRLAMSQQMLEIHRGMERFIVEKADDLRQRISANGGSPIEISVSGELVVDGFLSPRLNARSPYGQEYLIYVGQSGADGLEGVLLTQGGYRTLEDTELGRISTLLGASGGAVLSRDPMVLRGVFGGYQLNLAEYFPGADDLSGSLASVFFYDGRSIGSNFLHRYAVPGAPEANRMHTDIDMNTHGLDNVGYVDTLWRDDDDADEAAVSIRREGESGELFVIRNDGGIRKNDASGAAVYALDADGEIAGENLLLRAGAEVCRDNAGGCGVSFGRPGNRPGVKLANRGRNLTLQAPGQSGRYGLQVENRSGSVVARVDDRGIMNLRQGLSLCENNASGCGLSLGTAARMNVGNGTWVMLDARGSNTGFRVNRAFRVQQNLQVCMVNQASCTLQIGNGGSFRRTSSGWVELVPNTSSGGLRIAGSGTQLHAQGNLLVGRDAQFNRDVNVARDLSVGRYLDVGNRIRVGSGANQITLAGGRVTAERGLRPQNVVTAGTNCSPTGLLGRTSGGNLMSCIDGKWQQNFSRDNVVIKHNSICENDDRRHELEARCPTNTRLVSCTGGPGDLDEDHEGFFIRPNPQRNSCELIIGHPRCSSGRDWQVTHVYAFCIKTEG